MKNFVDHLSKEVNVKIQQIEYEENNIFTKASKIVSILEEAFERMKSFFYDYKFANDLEEIHFFKFTKPQLFCRLIYYSKIYNIENLRPHGSIASQRQFILFELNQLTVYFNKNYDFIRYYRSGDTHLDKFYFLRGKHDIKLSSESFYFERDPKFSTNCDFKVAKILANELLALYLNDELTKIKMAKIIKPESFPNVKETWTRSKTDLVELIYAIWETKCFNNGNITLKRLTNYFENVFNIELGDVYHTYLSIRERTNRTQFLDKLKEKLINKMNIDDQK